MCIPIQNEPSIVFKSSFQGKYLVFEYSKSMVSECRWIKDEPLRTHGSERLSSHDVFLFYEAGLLVCLLHKLLGTLTFW